MDGRATGWGGRRPCAAAWNGTDDVDVAARPCEASCGGPKREAARADAAGRGKGAGGARPCWQACRHAADRARRAAVTARADGKEEVHVAGCRV
eukprot:scaffold3052_cov389-Prasinococcus_capsulatus_cf.AAC.6